MTLRRYMGLENQCLWQRINSFMIFPKYPFLYKYVNIFFYCTFSFVKIFLTCTFLRIHFFTESIRSSMTLRVKIYTCVPNLSGTLLSWSYQKKKQKKMIRWWTKTWSSSKAKKNSNKMFLKRRIRLSFLFTMNLHIIE